LIKNAVPVKTGTHLSADRAVEGWTPAFAGLLHNSKNVWITAVRPSKRPLRGLLRMTLFLPAIIDLRRPEILRRPRERPSKDARTSMQY
jgi:hypothetical protein